MKPMPKANMHSTTRAARHQRPAVNIAAQIEELLGLPLDSWRVPVPILAAVSPRRTAWTRQQFSSLSSF